VQGSRGSWHTIPRWGVVCVGKKQIILVPASLGHTAYKGGTRANARTASSSIQMLGAWAFGFICVRVGTI